jgi:bifunctional UDP-N-acetylglucosamine pyrophosphorylase / glucosamine-1-phosphate N-acetyltransferase
LDGWLEKGVRIRDPRTTVIDADVRIGRGTLIQPHTVIEEGSTIGKGCVIGPFARIRGGSKIADGAIVGNFVEVVRSTIGRASQVKHLSYLGDAEVGRSVNVGAGTITANYDGRRKHRTVIRDGARIGSGTVLIAPVTIGKNAVTGAGSVVTQGRNVPAGGVVVGVPARPLGKKIRPTKGAIQSKS